MQAAVAYSTMAMTVGLALARPGFAVRGAKLRLGPAFAGLLGLSIVLATRLVGARELVDAAATLWRPLVTIASIMLMAESARELGLLDALAARLQASRLDVRRLHATVFVVTALATVLLNNDSAVLVLTPLVVTLIRRRHPHAPELVAPFAWAVFLAAGVAPLLVSNPMNMIVASTATWASIDFDGYALTMVPIWLAGCALTYALLRRQFRRELSLALPPPRAVDEKRAPLSLRAKLLALMLLLVLLAYPVATLAGAPLWPVAATGAALALALTPERRLRRTFARGVTWNILLFLYAVFVIALALGKVGVVALLARLYAGQSPVFVGATTAIGAALVDNHPMAILDVLALGKLHATRIDLLAAMIGGDLGPRMLPIGSLAGLIWLESLRRSGVSLPLKRFVAVGVTVTLPVLALSLALLLLGHG